MVYKENEQVYLTLPRKDLQGLCRKHGLSVSHRKDELAKKLVTYFTKKKETSMKRQKKNGRVGSSSKLARSPGRKSKHNKQNNSSERNVKDDGSACPKTVDVKEKHSHKVDKDLNATPAADMWITVPSVLVNCNREAGVMKQIGKNSLNHGTAKLTSKNLQLVECSSETGRVNSLKTQMEIPASFQFYVRSEEGINLFVDFNTNTSDWINSLKDEVSIQQKTHCSNSWTICNEVKDARNIAKSLKSSGGINMILSNVDSSNDSRSHALTLACLPVELTKHMDEKNETLSSSCMTCSHVQNCGAFGCLSCSANTEAPLQNPADSSSAATKSNASVACDSSNKVLSNLDVNLSTDTTVTDKLVVNADYISSYNPELVSRDDSLKCISERGGFSLSGINKDSSKPSENDGIDNCNDKNLILPQSDDSDADESTDHFYEYHPCSGHGISAIKNPMSSHGEKVRSVKAQLKETIRRRCETVKRCKRTCTTGIHVDFRSKRQHVGSGDQSELPINLRKTKTLARESICDQRLLRRRSVRLGSK